MVRGTHLSLPLRYYIRKVINKQETACFALKTGAIRFFPSLRCGVFWRVENCQSVGCAQLVEALRYKPEGRRFDSRWCHWNFP